MKKVIKKVASWLGKLRSKPSPSSRTEKSPVAAGEKKSSGRRDRPHPRTEQRTGGRGTQGRRRRGRSTQSGDGERQRGPKKEEKPDVRAQKPRTQPRHAEAQRPKEHEQEAPKIIDDSWNVSQYVVAPQEGKARFHDLNLPNGIMHAIADLKFQYCTPIQAGVMPKSLQGQDVIGQAQTGTGKSAAFLITILNHLLKTPSPEQRRKGTPRALVLAPTRELVMQIEKDAQGLSKYIPCRIVSVFGGMHYEKQKRALDSPVDIIVATPGRLIDFKSQHIVHLNRVEILVIDEADRMLDMGFIPDIRNIVHSTPMKDTRQTIFFSATMTEDVMRLAGHWTRDAHKEAIEPENIAVNTIDQKIYITTTEEKFALLFNMITQQNLERAIVFTNRRDEAQKVFEGLMSRGVSAGLLSGDIDQRKRIRTLEDLRLGAIRVLVATDVAARGLHIEGVSHVINYNLPLDAEDYVHRIGRTGRAGASGTSVSFACEEDGTQIPVIEAFIARKLEYIYPPDEWLRDVPSPTVDVPKQSQQPKKRFDNRRRSPRHSRRGGGNRRRPGGGDKK